MYRNLRAILLGATSAIFMASAGHAADLVAAPPPTGFNWSGFYVGVGGGFGAVNHKIGVSGLGSFNGIGGEGLFGELTVGYDHMLTDRILLGGFIDTHVGNIGMNLDAAPLINADLTNSYGFDAIARLGYVLNDSTLGYVLGGYTWEHFKLDASSPFFGGSFDYNESRSGYVLGVGMETAIGHNWTIKTEYRYADYGNKSVLDLAPGTSLNVEPSTHTFHIAANYRFGAEGTGPAIASPAYDWTGFYVGAALGAGEVVHDLSIFGGAADLNGIGGEGVFGELNAGYDHDFGNFVAGAMVDGNLSGISTDLDIGGGGGSAHLKADYGFDILGRVGMKVNPSTLAYVLGGYSWAHFKAEASGPAFGGSGSYDWNSSGFSVGGGLETAVATNTTLGIEYRYAQFGSEDFGSGGAFEVKPSSHTVRVGLKYKFN
ncbi:MAG: outer membrane beta-barrel protein [Hyphomicrobiales bacterium]|nr:outer membrane beta-barrel protein [Hyphomicrobiales bacterium]